MLKAFVDLAFHTHSLAQQRAAHAAWLHFDCQNHNPASCSYMAFILLCFWGWSLEGGFWESCYQVITHQTLLVRYVHCCHAFIHTHALTHMHSHTHMHSRTHDTHTHTHAHTLTHFTGAHAHIYKSTLTHTHTLHRCTMPTEMILPCFPALGSCFRSSLASKPPQHSRQALLPQLPLTPYKVRKAMSGPHYFSPRSSCT